MINVVTKAIQQKAIEKGCDCLFLSDDLYMNDLAKAAIEAMREPTEEMLEVAYNKMTDHEIWQAMIDAALKD